MKDSEVEQYLKRIKLNDCSSDLDSLIILQQNHIKNIPFENLDVIAGRSIKLNNSSLFQKIISRHRGGYCFELNLLFSTLLKSLGFSPKPVLGRVWLRNPNKIPPRNHLAHLVVLNGETFITDVGFGGLTTRIPLNINNESEVDDNDGIVRIIHLGKNQYMIQRKVQNDWANQYSFENIDISEEDIFISNYYMSTNSNSHFFNDNFVGKFTEGGRIGLFNNQMSIRKGIEVVGKKHIPYGSEWIETLERDFNLIPDFTKKELTKIFQKQ